MCMRLCAYVLCAIAFIDVISSAVDTKSHVLQTSCTDRGKDQPDWCYCYQAATLLSLATFKNLLRTLSLKVCQSLSEVDLWEKLPQRKKMKHQFPQFNKLSFIFRHFHKKTPCDTPCVCSVGPRLEVEALGLTCSRERWELRRVRRREHER